MYPEDLLESIFDVATCQYLKQKNRGGTSNAKGSTYENVFAVFQIAHHARDYIENGEAVIFASQIQAFVDDLIIACRGEALLKHYQLKNSSSVAWGSGLKSIADDFEKQLRLNRAVNKDSELGLVVSDGDLRDRLAAAIPAGITQCSQVLHFPYRPTLMQVIGRLPKFRAAIAYLSAFEDPADDKIDYIATVLLGAWESLDRQNVTIEEILTRAQQCQPSFIRSFTAEPPELDAEVVTILSQVEDFTYTLTKGFLHWQYKGGIEQGTLRYSCETPDFQRFQELIKKHTPSSFEELEGFLL